MSHIRPYDVAMSDLLRDAVIRRRQNPDGELLEVGVIQRGTTRLMSYPWDRMKLGDFFFVPLQGQTYGSLQVRFRQAAARRDWELAVLRVERNGQPCLRVCLTLTGVRALKDKAKQHHQIEGLRNSDGQWSKTRKARRDTGKPTGAPRRARPTKVALRVVETPGDPTETPGEVDATLSPGYDRAAVLRDRLRALGE